MSNYLHNSTRCLFVFLLSVSPPNLSVLLNIVSQIWDEKQSEVLFALAVWKHQVCEFPDLPLVAVIIFVFIMKLLTSFSCVSRCSNKLNAVPLALCDCRVGKNSFVLDLRRKYWFLVSYIVWNLKYMLKTERQLTHMSLKICAEKKQRQS